MILRNPLPALLCAFLAVSSTWSEPAFAKRKKVKPDDAADSEAPPEEGAPVKLPPPGADPNGPAWGSKPVRVGRVEAAAPLIKVVGMTKMTQDEKFFVLSDEYNSILGELVARKVSRKRTMAQCELVALRAGFKKNELIGKPVVRENDLRVYLKRFALGSMEGGGGGGGGNVAHDRNPLVLLGVRTESYRGAAYDLMTGSDLRQEVETVGGELELFLPLLAPDSILNWFGLRVSLVKQQKAELVGKSLGSSQRTRFKMEGSTQKLQLAFRPTFASKLPSRALLLITASEQRSDKLTSSEAKSVGNPGDLSLELTTKGAGAYLGGVVSPFDGFHLGLGVDVPIAHTVSLKETGDGAAPVATTGKWSRLEAELWGGVRWPRPTGQGGIAVDMRAGMTYRSDSVTIDPLAPTGKSQSKTIKDVMKWVAVGVGYVP